MADQFARGSGFASCGWVVAGAGSGLLVNPKTGMYLADAVAGLTAVVEAFVACIRGVLGGGPFARRVIGLFRG